MKEEQKVWQLKKICEGFFVACRWRILDRFTNPWGRHHACYFAAMSIDMYVYKDGSIPSLDPENKGERKRGSEIEREKESFAPGHLLARVWPARACHVSPNGVYIYSRHCHPVRTRRAGCSRTWSWFFCFFLFIFWIFVFSSFWTEMKTGFRRQKFL